MAENFKENRKRLGKRENEVTKGNSQRLLSVG